MCIPESMYTNLDIWNKIKGDWAFGRIISPCPPY